MGDMIYRAYLEFRGSISIFQYYQTGDESYKSTLVAIFYKRYTCPMDKHNTLDNFKNI